VTGTVNASPACLDDETLADLVEGRLSETGRGAAEAHIAHCADCRRLLSELAFAVPAKTFASEHEAATIIDAAAVRPEEHPPTFVAGQKLAERYLITRFIARGGMGEVYRADDLELHRVVALKTLRPEIAADPRALDRFKREITIAQRVTHPNVCRIYDIGFHPTDAGKIAFLTMEFLDGISLSRQIAAFGPMRAEEALPLVEQMASALATAHAAGVIHRDFKSPNVMLVPSGASEGSRVRAVVTDFGLARSHEHERDHFSTSEHAGMVGSPAYMAPEQVTDQPLSPATDIYAFGVVLFEMRTGRWPFLESTPALTAIRRLEHDPPSPRSFVPEIDARWERTILRCLERDPRQRFLSLAEVPAALIAPLSTPSRPKRLRAAWAAAILAALAGAFAVHHRDTKPRIDAPAPLAAQPPRTESKAPTIAPESEPTRPVHDLAQPNATTSQAKKRRKPKPAESYQIISDYPARPGDQR
jgi:serine/threonine protein kinase